MLVPVRGRLQCNNQAIENEVEAVTNAPCRPNVVEIVGRSVGAVLDRTSLADVYEGALCSFNNCEATIT